MSGKEGIAHSDSSSRECQVMLPESVSEAIEFGLHQSLCGFLNGNLHEEDSMVKHSPTCI